MNFPNLFSLVLNLIVVVFIKQVTEVGVASSFNPVAFIKELNEVDLGRVSPRCHSSVVFDSLVKVFNCLSSGHVQTNVDFGVRTREHGGSCCRV